VNRDLHIVLGGDGQVVRILLDTIQEDAHIGIIPSDWLIELHQQELIIYTWIRFVDYMTRNDNTRIATRTFVALDDAPNNTEAALTPESGPLAAILSARITAASHQGTPIPLVSNGNDRLPANSLQPRWTLPQWKVTV